MVYLYIFLWSKLHCQKGVWMSTVKNVTECLNFILKNKGWELGTLPLVDLIYVLPKQPITSCGAMLAPGLVRRNTQTFRSRFHWVFCQYIGDMDTTWDSTPNNTPSQFAQTEIAINNINTTWYISKNFPKDRLVSKGWTTKKTVHA